MSRAADSGSDDDAGIGHNVGADDPLTKKEGWRRFVDHQPARAARESGAGAVVVG